MFQERPEARAAFLSTKQVVIDEIRAEDGFTKHGHSTQLEAARSILQTGLYTTNRGIGGTAWELSGDLSIDLIKLARPHMAQPCEVLIVLPNLPEEIQQRLDLINNLQVSLSPPALYIQPLQEAFQATVYRSYDSYLPPRFISGFFNFSSEPIFTRNEIYNPNLTDDDIESLRVRMSDLEDMVRKEGEEWLAMVQQRFSRAKVV